MSALKVYCVTYLLKCFLCAGACLCLSQISSFMGTNPVAVSASALAGQTATTQALVTLVSF